MDILIIHPEGNVNYNVNLLGLAEMLCEAGHRVTYAAPRWPHLAQESPLPSMRMILLEDRTFHGPVLFPAAAAPNEDNAGPDFASWSGYDFVFGVDRGIIEGAWIARHFGIPHALISYELFFAEETSIEFTAPKVDACRDLAFATCQDVLRSRKLCMEYGIAPDKVLPLPVAGRDFRDCPSRPRLLHYLFELPEHVKTVLHMGSFSDWTRAPFLLESTHAWPEDWVLVIHDRHGPSAGLREQIRRLGHPDRIRLSEATFVNPEQMSAFIQSADLGAALYHATYQAKGGGRNLEHIGLSSGKISTYLQHGVPVATHDLGEISDWIQFYAAGQVFSLDRPFVPEDPGPQRALGCRKLFERHLDLERFGPAVLRAMEMAVAGAT
ncbi:MAG: hypothetical protein V4787_00210 [Pseudomonadota bacterium]